MTPHPDFAGADLPRSIDLGELHLTPLNAHQTDEDFAAVTGSASVLQGSIFGDWPAGLTLDDNRIDLAWHDREFTTNRSFSWIIRDAHGAYLGCFYIFPEIGARGQADAALWIRDLPNRADVAGSAYAAIAAWVKEHIPASVTLTWKLSPDLQT